jgi:hypothetical protein
MLLKKSLFATETARLAVRRLTNVVKARPFALVGEAGPQANNRILWNMRAISATFGQISAITTAPHCHQQAWKSLPQWIHRRPLTTQSTASAATAHAFSRFAKSFSRLEWDYDGGQELKKFQDAASLHQDWMAEAYLGILYSVGTHRLIPQDSQKAQAIGQKVVPMLQDFVSQKSSSQSLDEEEQGNAFYLLALYHELGLGLNNDTQECTPNLPQAVAHYLSAAKCHNLPAKQRLGDLTRFNTSSSSITAADPRMNFQHALTWYQSAAEAGFANAQFSLGNCYLQGYPNAGATATSDASTAATATTTQKESKEGRNGKDIPKALHWFREAAKQGHLAAQYHLGWCLANGIMRIHQRSERHQQQGSVGEVIQEGLQQQRQDYEQEKGTSSSAEEELKEAMHWIQESARHGYPSAQHYLGLCYNDGYGVEQNQEQSFYWLSKVAMEHDDLHAAFHIAMMLLRGYWSSSSATSFASPNSTLYSASASSSSSSTSTSEHVGGDVVFWLRFAAERGHSEAQANLGILLAQGSKGVTKDMTEALKWFEKAAKQGNPTAQYNAAVCYLHGHGTVPAGHKDEVKAMSLYQVAAENGHPDAQSHLAFCYFNGSHGCKEDLKQGFEWLKKAADVEVHGIEKANLNAIFFTGICYSTGRGVTEPNPQLGEEYIRLAAERGHPTAREMVSAADSDKDGSSP